DGLERVRLQPSLARDWLRVVVTVEEDGAASGRHAALAENEGVARGLEHAAVETALRERCRQPARSLPHARRVLAYRVEPHEFHEPVDDRAATGREPAIERRPVVHRERSSRDDVIVAIVRA